MATERQIDLSPGNRNYFGIKDYKANRPYFSNLQIKEYLDANRGVVNDYGGEQLYNKIAGTGTPGTGWGKNKSMFGRDDLAMNRNLGWTDREIGDYLRANQGVLADHNRTGFQAPNKPGYENTILQNEVTSSNANWWTRLNTELPEAPSLPEPVALPGTQTGQANVGAGYNALGIRTPRPAGHDLNTGGTKKAFGRDKKNKDIAAAQLAINPLTL